MKFRPLHDRVVVKRIDAEEKSAGGIIIPDTAKEKPSEGEIIAADVRRFSYLINTDKVFGTHRYCRRHRPTHRPERASNSCGTTRLFPGRN